MYVFMLDSYFGTGFKHEIERLIKCTLDVPEMQKMFLRVQNSL